MTQTTSSPEKKLAAIRLVLLSEAGQMIICKISTTTEILAVSKHKIMFGYTQGYSRFMKNLSKIPILEVLGIRS